MGSPELDCLEVKVEEHPIDTDMWYYQDYSYSDVNAHDNSSVHMLVAERNIVKQEIPSGNMNYVKVETEDNFIETESRAPRVIYENNHERSDITSVQQLNAGKKLFNCSYCSKQFENKIELVAHQKTPTGEKPY